MARIFVQKSIFEADTEGIFLAPQIEEVEHGYIIQIDDDEIISEMIAEGGKMLKCEENDGSD